MSADFPSPNPAGQTRTTARERQVAWILAALTFGYLLPWAIAVQRNTRHRWWVLAVAGLLGWTVFGWVAALVMAIIGEQMGTQSTTGPLSNKGAAWIAKHPVGASLLAPLALLTAIVAVLAFVLPSDEDSVTAADESTSETTDEPSGATDTEDETSEDSASAEPSPIQSPSSEPDQGQNKGDSDPTEPTPPKPTKNPDKSTKLVTRVIDGDTVELGNGKAVRVLGIDTPERGECNYETASRRMAQLVEGKEVILTRHDENTDRYDRLLRYINIGTADPGLRLIKEGLAIARYDSRDGYGYHPREPRYIAADNANPQRTCAPEPEPEPNSNCASGYNPCIPSFPPDVNCADVNGPIRVTGSDPHGLDRDGDGIACES